MSRWLVVSIICVILLVGSYWLWWCVMNCGRCYWVCVCWWVILRLVLNWVFSWVMVILRCCYICLMISMGVLYSWCSGICCMKVCVVC